MKIEHIKNKYFKMITFQHTPTITDLSPELLCHILEFLPLKGILSVGMLCRKLSTAVNMHFRLCKSIDFCPDSVSGYMPSTITDDHMHALLKKCPLLETVYGLHPVKVERRRLRKRSSLTVPGIIEALNLCFHLKAVETSDLKLFEAIMQHIPQLEIIGHFQNRDGVFPPHASQKLKLHPYPRVTSLHLIGVEVPELTAMPHLQHLHLQCVRFTKLQPFRAFLAQNLESFVMKHCIGPAMSLRYLSLIIALSSSPNLKHLELVRVPLPGGLFQRAVEDSHRHNGFVNLRTLVIAGCKGVLEADLGHLMIVSSKYLQTLFIQPSLTKDSLFVSLSYAQCVFPSLQNLHLGYIDSLNYSGEWSNDALLSFGLAEVPDTPSSITDSGMKVISQLLPHIKSLSVSNCPHLMVMYQWMPGNNLEAWSELTDLTLQKCHCLQLSSFTVFVSLLPCIQVITLNEMFKEPPKGCSHVGLSAGTGLGMSSAVVSNQDEHIAVQGHQQEFDHPGEEENEEIEREIIEGDNEDNLEPHFMVLRGDFFEEDDDIVYIDYENRRIDEALQHQNEEYSSDDSSQSSSDDVYVEREYGYIPPPPAPPPPARPRPVPRMQLPTISPPPALNRPSRSNRSRRMRRSTESNFQYHLRQTPKRLQQSKSVGVQADDSLESKSVDSNKMSEDSADSGGLNYLSTNYDPHKPSTSRAGRHLDYSHPMSSDSELEVDLELNESTRKTKKVSSNSRCFRKKRKKSNMTSFRIPQTFHSKFETGDSSDSEYVVDGRPFIIDDNDTADLKTDFIEIDNFLSNDSKLVKPCSVVLTKIEDCTLGIDMSVDMAHPKCKLGCSSPIKLKAVCDYAISCSSSELKEVISDSNNILSNNNGEKCESDETEPEILITKIQKNVCEMSDTKFLSDEDAVLKSMSCCVHLTKIKNLCDSTSIKKSNSIIVSKLPSNAFLDNNCKKDSKKNLCPNASIEQENEIEHIASVPYIENEGEISINHREASGYIQSTKNKSCTSSSCFSTDHENLISSDCNSIKEEFESTSIRNYKYVEFPNASECVPSTSQKKEFSHCCVHIDKIKFPSNTNGINCNTQISSDLNLQSNKLSVNQYNSLSLELSQTTKDLTLESPKCSKDVHDSVSCKHGVNSDTTSENSDLDQKSFASSVKRKQIQSSKSIIHDTLKDNKNEMSKLTHSDKRNRFLYHKSSKLTSSNQYNRFKNENVSTEENYASSSQQQSYPSTDILTIEGDLNNSESCCNICQQPSTSKGIEHNISLLDSESPNDFYNVSNKASNQELIRHQFSSSNNSVPHNCYVKVERLEDETLNSSFKTEYEKIKKIDCSSIKIPHNFVKVEDNSLTSSSSNNNFEDTPKLKYNSSNLPEPKRLKKYHRETDPNILPEYYIDIPDSSLKSVKIIDSSTGKSHEISNCKVLISKIEDVKSSMSLTSAANESRRCYSDSASDTQSVTFVEYDPHLPSTSSTEISNLDMICKSTDLSQRNNSTCKCKKVKKCKKSLYSRQKKRGKGKTMPSKILNKSSGMANGLNDRSSNTSTPTPCISKSKIDSGCSQNTPETLKINNSDVAIILRKENSNINDSLDINNNSLCKGIKIEETADSMENNNPANFCIVPQCSSSSAILKNEDQWRSINVKSETRPRRFSERIHNKILSTQRNGCIDNKSKEINRPTSKRRRKKKTSIPMISMISQGTQANSADIRRSVRRIRRVRAHRSVASSSYSPATGKISSKATSKKPVYKDYDPETLDKATSTSDPLLEDDAVQVLQLSSDTLLSFTIVACGISDLTIDQCPKLFHLEVQACRILKRFELNTCPVMRRLNICQCPKLSICELSSAVLSLSTDSYILVTYEPCMQSYDPGDGEKEVLSKAALSQSVLLCHDFYEPSDESCQATFQGRLLAWLHYMSKLYHYLNYIRGKSYRKKTEIPRSSEYPWSHDIRRIHGQYTKTSSEFCSTEGHYDLLTNNPIFCDIFETYKIYNEFPSISDCEAYRNNSLLSYEAIEKYSQMRKKFVAFYIPITKYNRTETYKLVSS